MNYKTKETVFYTKQVFLTPPPSPLSPDGNRPGGSRKETGTDSLPDRKTFSAGGAGNEGRQEKDTFPVLTFAAWEDLPGVRHCFTTRAGGVSEGFLSSLNFRRDSYDTQENLLENYRRAALWFKTGPDRVVCAQQTHTANVRLVTEADAGKGVTRERDYTDVDGLITNVPGLVLFTSHADCVPLYFYDPVRRVIALSHSGWKGTAARIGAVTVRKMQEIFGCRPQNIHAAIGPSICSGCYEVSEDVAEAFRDCFGKDSEAVPAVSRADAEEKETIPQILARGRGPGKYQLDLWAANERILLEAGITPEHLTVTNLCTCENSSELFSHRATGGKRGNQGAFLMLDTEDRQSRA